MKIVVIGNARLVRGFELAGIKDTRVARPGNEEEEEIDRWVKDPELGVIVIDNTLKLLISRLKKALQYKKGAYPVLIVLGTIENEEDHSPAGEIFRMPGLG